jgi:glycosyltransferase involved in cell wall biosynthesis
MCAASSTPSPLVSIVVPNYNHAKFLPQRIESILAQTFRDYELIVLDDCSPDNSREVIQTLSARAPMRVVFNEKNSGSPFIQWERGAALAKGKYLWIAESDDFADPNLLQRLVSVLEEHPNVGLAYCQSRRVSVDGTPGALCEDGNRILDETRWTRDYVNNGRDELARYLIVQNTIPNASAVVIRRDVFQRAVQGAGTRRLSGDWWTWARMLLESDVAFVAQPLNYFRMHDHSVRETTKSTLATAERLSLQAHFCREVSPSLSVRALSFRTSYGPWRHQVRGPAFNWNWKWLAATHRDARRVYPFATARMLGCVARASIGRINRNHSNKGRASAPQKS